MQPTVGMVGDDGGLGTYSGLVVQCKVTSKVHYRYSCRNFRLLLCEVFACIAHERHELPRNALTSSIAHSVHEGAMVRTSQTWVMLSVCLLGKAHKEARNLRQVRDPLRRLPA